MKKFIAGVVACVLILSGCSKTLVEDKSRNNNDTILSMFVIVEHTNIWLIVYHKDTKVMYTVSQGVDNRGDFTLLVNPDGTPMIWEE